MSNQGNPQIADDTTSSTQIAQATPATDANAPMNGAQLNGIQSPPANQNTTAGQVLRIPVQPGETVTLPSPFDADHHLDAREGDGNLAIKVGDVTVILQGFVDASSDPTRPVTVVGDDGKPIDVATVLATTDPSLDIQTAAGPAAVGAQGAGAGHFLTAFAGGAGLGGLSAVGPQDLTSLSYGLIDGSIRLALPTPANNALSVTGSTVTVDEAAMPTGSNPTSNAETTTGSITINATSGVASITIDGKAIDLSNPTTTITGTHGDLTITSWDPATGTLDYSYTLTHNLIHPDIQGRNIAEGDDFNVVATDKAGGSGSGDIVVDVIDDVPTARVDAAFVPPGGTVSGNVLANDTPGADGIVAITEFREAGRIYELTDKGTIVSTDSPANYSYDAATGVLHIDKTDAGGSIDIDLTGANIGHYDYQQGNGNSYFDDFRYTVVDADGDKSHNDLAFHVKPEAVDDQIFALASGFTVEDSWLMANDHVDSLTVFAGTGAEHQLTLSDIGDGLLVTLDPGQTSGSFDYTIGVGGNADSAKVDASLVTDPMHNIDQSANTHDVILIGDANNNVLTGGSGNDVIFGGGGHDTLIGNAGNDTFIYGADATFDGGSGTDRVVFESGTNLGFDSATADRFHSIEVLDFRNGVADHLGSTAGTALTAEAVLDMTGGKGELWIAGDASDSISLDAGFTKGAAVLNTTVGDGIPDGPYSTYTADFGGHTATVHIETQVATHI